MEFGHLGHGILSGAGIEYQKHFMGRVLIELAGNSADLFKLFHQVAFIVQATCGVGKNHIYIFGPRRLNCIEDNRGTIGTGMLGDHGARPHTQMHTQRDSQQVWNLGRYADEADAAAARDVVAKVLGYHLNFPEGRAVTGQRSKDAEQAVADAVRAAYALVLGNLTTLRSFLLRHSAVVVTYWQFLANKLSPKP